MPRGVKNTEALEELVEAKESNATKEAIEALIVKLCDDVTNGRSRDEFKALEAIADLYNAVK